MIFFLSPVILPRFSFGLVCVCVCVHAREVKGHQLDTAALMLESPDAVTPVQEALTLTSRPGRPPRTTPTPPSLAALLLRGATPPVSFSTSAHPGDGSAAALAPY